MTLAGLDRTTEARQNSVAYALVEGKGSCSALVATVLALAEGSGSPFNVLVLRDHVVLSSTAVPGTYYEVLDGGRRIGRDGLARHQPLPPGGPQEVSPRSFEAFYLDNLAARLAEAGDAAVAEAAFGRALAIDGGPARVRYNYGTFLLQQERFAEAEKMLAGAIERGWRDAAAYVNRGAARWRLGRVKTARRDFERALQLDPTNREAAANLRRLGEQTRPR